MNLIEAWNLAKDTQEIYRENYVYGVRKCDYKNNILNMLNSIRHQEDVLANDWDIKKEHRKVSCLAGIFLSEVGHLTDGDFAYNGVLIPHNAQITLEWDE